MQIVPQHNWDLLHFSDNFSFSAVTERNIFLLDDLGDTFKFHFGALGMILCCLGKLGALHSSLLIFLFFDWFELLEPGSPGNFPWACYFHSHLFFFAESPGLQWLSGDLPQLKHTRNFLAWKQTMQPPFLVELKCHHFLECISLDEDPTCHFIVLWVYVHVVGILHPWPLIFSSHRIQQCNGYIKKHLTLYDLQKSLLKDIPH